MRALSKKKIVSAILLAISVLFGVSAVASLNQVTANAAFVPETFEMESGAGLILYENGGLRFIVKMDKSTATYVKSTAGVELGFIIAPRSTFDDLDARHDADLTYYNLITESTSQVVYARNVIVEKNKIYRDESDENIYYANGCLFNVQSANRKMEYTATAYIRDGANVTLAKSADDAAYNKDLNTTSLYYLLNRATLDSENDYTAKIMGLPAYNAWYGTQEYPIGVESSTVAEKLSSEISKGNLSASAHHYNVADGIDLGSLTLSNTTNQSDYTVEHYLQNVENDKFTPQVQVEEGTTGDKVEDLYDRQILFPNHTYDPSIAENINVGVINASERMKLRYYYTRNDIKEIRGFEQTETDTYKATGHGDNQRSYYFRNSGTVSDTAVFSVEITMPSVPVRVGGQWTMSGITLTNTETAECDPTAYRSILIGLNEYGLVATSHHKWQTSEGLESTTGMARRLDRENHFDFDTVNPDIAFTQSTLTRRLSVVLQYGTLYIYVDGNFVRSIGVDSDYFNTAFSKDMTFTFGVSGLRLGWAEEEARPTIKVLTEKYAEDAEKEIRANYSLKDNFTYDAATNTYTSGSLSWASGQGFKMSYAYSSIDEEYSNTAVLTTKISVKDAAGTAAAALVTGDDAGNVPPLIGIRMTAESSNLSAMIGLSTTGLIGYMHKGMPEYSYGDDDQSVNSQLEMGRRFDLGIEGENIYKVASQPNDQVAFTADHTERTLTVILYKDSISMLVDNNLILSWPITSATFWGWDGGFSEDESYRFGLVLTQFNPMSNKIEMQITEELYGEEAISSIKSHLKLERGATANADGSYTLAQANEATNWMNPSYVFSGKYSNSNTAVYSVSITATAWEAYKGFESSVGIAISNGQQYVTGETLTGSIFKPANDPEDPNGAYQNARAVSGYHGFSMGYRNHISNGNDGLYGALAYIPKMNQLGNCNGKYFYESEEENPTHTVTVVLYNGVFYFYADDNFNCSFAITDSAFAITGGTGTRYEFKTTNRFMFGMVSSNMPMDVTVSVATELYGTDAINELKTNTRYSNISVS